MSSVGCAGVSSTTTAYKIDRHAATSVKRVAISILVILWNEIS